MKTIKDKIAVVGMANLFPGSESPEAFWQQLLDKHEGKSQLTAEQMQANPQDYLGKEGDVDKFYCLRGGFIKDFNFNPYEFNVPAETLMSLDELFQWSLTVSRSALQQAGYWESEDLKECGILLGNLSFPTKHSNHLFLPLYRQALENSLSSLSLPLKINDFASKPVGISDAHIAGYPASLIAQACGLGGTHFALDAACASSCYSVQLACQYLQAGKAKMMLAGAVSAADPMFVHMGFSIFHAYPANQIHAPFDQQSQGLFAGEGAGMLVLKRLSDALAEGDDIHAVIEGGGLSNDGKGEFVLSPNQKGQVLAYQRAYADAGIQASSVDYVECHATGTPKGDRVELASMERFFQDAGGQPFIGSVKSNLGHLLTAAGMPGMMKVITALNQKTIPATINIQQPIASPKGYFSSHQMVTDTLPWPVKADSDSAAVSVFGFGGSNAHLVFRRKDDASEPKHLLKPREPMAIVGMDSHFGVADSLDSFQQLISTGANNFIELPEKRWKGFDQHNDLLSQLGLTKRPKAGFIDHFDMDFLHFKIPPNEQDCLIPQQLLMMKVADNAVQRAGLKPGANVSVLVAMGIEPELHQYRGRVNLSTQVAASLKQQGIDLTSAEQSELTEILKDSVAGAAGLNQYTSFIGNIMASRISALWDFSGPALTISAEENSVFRALELAENIFQTTDVEAVVVAAVDLAGSYENLYCRSQSVPILDSPNPDLWSQAGFIPGDGAGAIVVKPQSKAKGQGYATIDGLGVSQGISADNICQAGKDALHQSDFLSQNVDTVEAFISGDPLKNAAEKHALTTLYPNAHVSCIKQQIGHTFNASGMASLISCAIKLHSNEASVVAINGIGYDGASTHIVMSKANEAYHANTLSNKKSLMKAIQLGGDDHFHVIQSRLSSSLCNRLSTLIQAHSEAVTPAQNLQGNKPMSIELSAKNIPIEGGDVESFSTEPTTDRLLQQQLLTHKTFLQVRLQAQRVISNLLLSHSNAVKGESVTSIDTDNLLGATLQNTAILPDILLPERFSQPKQIIFDQADLVEFAEGDISKVFGPEYGVIDQYHRRVRLPTSDYLLVTRVTDLDAEVNVYKPSYMATEYDIPTDAPFLVDGQIPWSVSVESGQCDLMLISFIGIDFQAKGERVYRLLDCELTFLEDMAFGGQTLRYEIHIDSYAKNGDQLLFFFHYDCFVEGKKVLIMRGGCAGFFTDEELSEGKGVIHTEEDKAELANAKKTYFSPLIHNDKTAFSYDDMMRLVHGDIVGCLGNAYDQGSRNPSLKFSSEKFLMIENISHIDSTGGHWGLGLLVGHKQLEPDHWYFPCHFKDDQVMAGSLMSEGCGQLAMFYMLWLGMHSNAQNARFQPVPGAPQKVRCRGQVTPQSNILTYRMEITSITMTPFPSVTANIDIILDDKVVVDFKNLSVMIKEQEKQSPYARQMDAISPIPNTIDKTHHGIENCIDVDETGKRPFNDVNRPLMWVETDTEAALIKGVKPIKHKPAPTATLSNRQNRLPDTLPFTPWHLFEFATGDIAQCFGSEFDVYQGRIPPRTPCGDLQLVTEVVAITGERHDLKNPATCIAHYDVPDDAWFFTKNAHPSDMPYSILMEIALQPNGFISGYIGTTLAYPEKDLFFRNLDGQGQFIKSIDLRGKTIVNDSTLLSTSMAGGSIIQSFTFDLSVEGETFYRGTAVFGYFSEESLTNQLGIDNGRLTQPWFSDKPNLHRHVIDLKNDQAVSKVNPEAPYFRLLKDQLNFLDTVTWIEEGGDFGKGYLSGERTIDPSDWFFRYHFHQDPVMPGSLGVEAMIELLKVYAITHELDKSFTRPRFTTPMTSIKWKYRGQITPINKTMTVDVHIKSIEQHGNELRIIGDANLSKDNLRIYQVTDIALGIIEADSL